VQTESLNIMQVHLSIGKTLMLVQQMETVQWIQISVHVIIGTYCGLYTVFLPFDSRVALSRRESVSTLRVCSAC
jgi:hypothetical protein